MGRPAKKTDNHVVAQWLIQHRWKESLNSGTKQKMPEFVEDAVMAAVYIVAGTSNGKTNISPKLVFKCLMLPEITTSLVKTREVGYDMSDRQAQRLAQCARFALDGIRHRVQEYESRVTDIEKESTEMERQFISDYYAGKDSVLYSPPMQELPLEISLLKEDGKYLEYAQAVRDFRLTHS